MAIQVQRPISNAQRHIGYLKVKGLSKGRPAKKLVALLKKHSGRNNTGKITVRHRGGRQKRYYRLIDFKRSKRDVPAIVSAIEYDPNRTANIALLHYVDGEKRYILAPDGLKVNDRILSSDLTDFKPGNAMSLKNIPLGLPIHNLEVRPGKGGQLVRSAGTEAIIQAKEGKYAHILLSSGEVRKILITCFATIGKVSNQEWQNMEIGKAGRKRRMGFRPSVRGSAMSPNAHPHGGGEGKAGIGMPSPKSPWGKKTLGKITRKRKKYSNKYIVQKRKK
jgi:large subunit ribosomal protein L2